MATYFTSLLLLVMINMYGASSQGTSECFPMDVALVLPTSATADSFSSLKAFVKNVLGQLDIGGSASTLQISIVKYRGTAQAEFGMGDLTTSAAILQAVDNMVAVTNAGNNVAAAMTATKTVFQGTKVRNSFPLVAIVFFDGRSDDQSATYAQAKILNDFGITVIAVGLTSSVDPTELSTVATQASYVISVQDYSQLSAQANTFISLLCSIRTKLCPKQADIALILDQSSSIASRPPGYYDNWFVSLRNFLGNITEAFRVGPDQTQFGVVQFSDLAQVIFPLNKYETNAELLTAVRSLDIKGGETNIADALRKARTQVLLGSPGSRVGVKKIAFLITDGAANRETEQTYVEANRTKESGIEIFTIGITNEVDVQQLQTIASIPVKDHYFYSQDFSNVNDILTQLFATSCAQPIYNFTSPSPSPTPTPTPSKASSTPSSTVSTTVSTTLSTTPTTSSTTTTTTPTTTTTVPRTSASPRPVGSCLPVDVVFVIDSSGSLDPAQFPSIINFILDVIHTFPIESGDVRVGLVTFSTEQKLVVPLNGYNNSFTSLQQAILAAQYSGKSSNKADVLSFLRTTVFTTANGARDNIPHLAVLITNTRSPNQQATLEQADMARRAGITILTIALGNWLDIDEIYAIGSFPKTVFNFHTGMANLTAMKDPVNNLICSKSDSCTSNPCMNGGTCTSLFGYYQCQCPAGYGGDNCNSACQGAGDVVFAIDSSGSIGPDNWRLNIDFITKVVQNMDIDGAMQANSVTGTRVALVIFNDAAVVKFQLNTYTTKSNLLQGLQTLYMAGGTNTADAIRVSIDTCFTAANGDRPNVPNYLVVVTDGKSNNTQQTIAQARRARMAGIKIVAVGVADYNYDELRAIASAPDAVNVLTAANYSGLSDALAAKIDALLCNTTNYCTADSCKNGATCSPKMGGFDCGPCPIAFTGPFCERACSGVMDFIVMLDVSGSINYDRFPLIKNFVISIVQQFDINPDRTRVAVMTFGDTSVTTFNLKDYTTAQDVIQGIRDIPFGGGRTNLAEALTHLRTMYTPDNGGRPTASHIVLIITDAMVNENMDNTIPEGVLVKNDNIEVVMVLIGAENYVDMKYAEALVSGSIETNIIQVTSYGALSGVTNKVVNSTCDGVDECHSNPCQNGGTCSNRYQRYACVCPFSKTGFNCEKTCTARLDIVFVLDFSGSIVDIEFLVSLIRAIIYGLDVTSDLVRVGVVSYATDVTNYFNLNTYTGSRDHLINAISFYQNGGTTNTQGAFKYVATNQFTAVNGDRSGIPNVVIWISDGYSNVMEGSSSSANAAAQLKQGGATIYTIGIGESPNVVEFDTVASDPASMYAFQLPSTNTTDINNVAKQVVDTLCGS